MAIQSVNPTTGEIIKTFQPHTEEELNEKLELSENSFHIWKKYLFATRATLFDKVAERLRKNKKQYAELMAIEMGKPLTQGMAEVEKCAWVCEYYADNAEKFLRSENVKTDSASSYVRFDPLGVVLGIMPWNFPFWQVFRACAPIMMGGNTFVLKHASNTPQCALAIEEIFIKSGFPEGIFTTILVEGKETSKVIADKRIAAVTLTGSETAGKRVAETAGTNLKKQVLELGGSDAFIVLADADIEQAARVAAQARTLNAGQSCIAAKRFIVVEKVAEKFTELLVEHMRKMKVGNPLDEGTEIGPMAREDLRDELQSQVMSSVEKGARILTGGDSNAFRHVINTTINLSQGAFYPPTVLTDVKQGSPAYEEELFGPVASVIVVKDEKEAVRVANDHKYGLGAAIWTSNTKKAEEMAVNLEAGAVFINDFVKSDPRLPFGGVKKSGYGRELGQYGIREFVNTKAVVIGSSTQNKEKELTE